MGQVEGRPWAWETNSEEQEVRCNYSQEELCFNERPRFSADILHLTAHSTFTPGPHVLLLGASEHMGQPWKSVYTTQQKQRDRTDCIIGHTDSVEHVAGTDLRQKPSNVKSFNPRRGGAAVFAREAGSEVMEVLGNSPSHTAGGQQGAGFESRQLGSRTCLLDHYATLSVWAHLLWHFLQLGPYVFHHANCSFRFINRKRSERQKIVLAFENRCRC